MKGITQDKPSSQTKGRSKSAATALRRAMPGQGNHAPEANHFGMAVLPPYRRIIE